MQKYLLLLIVFSVLCCHGGEDDVIKLLKDESLSQFEKKGGKASYTLENGVLTGVAVWNSPNTFLTTKEQYGDFILDYAIKIDPRLNSGVQIRSESFTDKNNYEMLRGYQVEIDPSKRAWSGGIYEEKGRGWIGNLCNNPAGRAAFKNDDWNDYHVEAVCHSIKVWVNGINTVNLLDDQGKSGVIGLQVHAIKKKEYIGTKVQWKNIALRTSDITAHLRQDDQLAPEINLLPNHLSLVEKGEGWKLIDRDEIILPTSGLDLKAWKLESNEFCNVSETHDSLNLTRVKGDFQVKFEYKIAKQGTAIFNYGYVDDQYSLVLADDKHLPEETDATMKAGSLANQVASTNLSNPDRNKSIRAHDQWSQVHLIVKGNNIQHWLNNTLVLDNTFKYFQNSEKSRLLVFKMKGDAICLRSIKVLNELGTIK